MKHNFFYSGDGSKKNFRGQSTEDPTNKPKSKDKGKESKPKLDEPKKESSETACRVFINKRHYQLQGIYDKQTQGLDSISLAGPTPPAGSSIPVSSPTPAPVGAGSPPN